MNNGVFKMIVAVGWNLESNSCTNAKGKNQSNKSNCDSRKLFEPLRNMFLVISKRTKYEVVSDLQGLSHGRATCNILVLNTMLTTFE